MELEVTKTAESGAMKKKVANVLRQIGGKDSIYACFPTDAEEDPEVIGTKIVKEVFEKLDKKAFRFPDDIRTKIKLKQRA